MSKRGEAANGSWPEKKKTRRGEDSSSDDELRAAEGTVAAAEDGAPLGLASASSEERKSIKSDAVGQRVKPEGKDGHADSKNLTAHVTGGELLDYLAELREDFEAANNEALLQHGRSMGKKLDQTMGRS